MDVNVIDGAVNGAASIVDGESSLLRRLQSGSVRAYAGSLFVGVVLILGTTCGDRWICRVQRPGLHRRETD